MNDLSTYWPVTQLGSVCTLITDGTHVSPKSQSGSYKYVTSKNIRYGTLDLADISYISFEEHSEIYKGCPVQFGDVLLTKDGANTGNAAINTLHEPFSLLSSVAIIRADDCNAVNEYILQYLLSPVGQRVIKNTMAGQAITRLTLQKIKNFTIPLPPLAEQRKIAAILGTWDTAIATTARLIAALRERKRGLMQRLLTGEVRFPGFGQACSGDELFPLDWKRVPLDDAFQRIHRTAETATEHVLSITATVGFVDQREKFGRVIAGNNIEHYILLQTGEFAYNKGNSGTYPQGCIYRLEAFDEGAVPNVYYCFRPKSANINGDFYKYYFEHGMLNRQLQRLINSGVRNDGLLNLAADAFFGVEIAVPSEEEQCAIAELLTCVDNEIQRTVQHLHLLREQKRGLMQQLLTGQVRVQVDEDDAHHLEGCELPESCTARTQITIEQDRIMRN